MLYFSYTVLFSIFVRSGRKTCTPHIVSIKPQMLSSKSSPDIIINPSAAMAMPEVSFWIQVTYLAASSPWDAGLEPSRGERKCMRKILPYETSDGCCPGFLSPTLLQPAPGALAQWRLCLPTVSLPQYSLPQLPFQRVTFFSPQVLSA